MGIEHQLPQVEDILSAYKEVIGADYLAYKNHIYRVVHLCYALGDFSEEEKAKIQIAACFHDIGIWTGPTLDYLPPSGEEAKSYLISVGKEAWIAEITQMIEMHHCVRSCQNSEYPLVEIFRRADIADFTLGAVPMGFKRKFISTLKSEFPNSGFHKRLLQLGVKWFVRHPLNPLPMFRG